MHNIIVFDILKRVQWYRYILEDVSIYAYEKTEKNMNKKYNIMGMSYVLCNK